VSLIDAVKRLARPLKPYLRPIIGPHPAKSYAQHGEDALVFSALMPGRRGFFVDVGAYDPIEGSNTYRLYKRGWRGLTIEPNPKAAWKFKLLRPGDRHLTMGVSAEPSVLRYHQFEIGMLNTTDAGRAKALERDGYRSLGVREIQCEPFDAILAQHAPGRHIDLLNVDCEGTDLDVLKSLDFVTQRPTVIVMEDLEGYYTLRGDGGSGASAVTRFMHERGYRPIAQLAYSMVFVALDWRALNRKTGAYREAAIHPNMLPEGEPPSAAASAL
jgi:FkbM family methyltransferase